jgi:mannitol/fructose-specific phosphotransferase system IIA component
LRNNRTGDFVSLEIHFKMITLYKLTNANMAFAGGPRKTIPRAFKASGNLGFSLACPHPANTASTFSRTACSTISLTKIDAMLLKFHKKLTICVVVGIGSSRRENYMVGHFQVF